MKLNPILLLAALLVASAQLCLAKLNVVATTPDFASIAQSVGGSGVEVNSLVRPTEDPHFIDPKPSFIVKLSKADVLIEGGAGLEEGWLPGLLQRAGNRRIAAGAPGRVEANKGIQMLEVPTTLDRSKGDIHAGGNPHFMIDPENAKIFARQLGEVFASVDAPNAAAYRANAEKFVQSIEKKLPEWQKQLAPYRGQSIVGYHNSWPYFAQRFGFKIDLFLEPKPGLPPTPGHLAAVIDKAREQKVRVIIVDRYLDRRTAETVANRIGASVVDVTHYPGGLKGTEAGYVELLDFLVSSLARAYEKTK